MLGSSTLYPQGLLTKIENTQVGKTVRTPFARTVSSLCIFHFLLKISEEERGFSQSIYYTCDVLTVALQCQPSVEDNFGDGQQA